MRRNPWPHHSHGDLLYAGFRFQKTSLCSGPRCGMVIHWYTTPAGKMFAVDQKSFVPHFSTCADRALFRRLARERQRPTPTAEPAKPEPQCTFHFGQSS
jgi:hypothetical protein